MVMVINENDRIFQAWGSVEIRDKQGDLIKMKDFEPVMLSMMKRGAPVIDNHSNRVVGKILNYEFKDKKVGDKDIPGLLLTCQIFDDFETDDEVWSDIKDGNATGMSFGGRARSKESIWFEGQPTNLLRKLEAFEFTVVREGRNPANPEAKMIAATIAKSDDYVEFCKVGVCKVCDKETKVLKSENLNNYDDIIKSMSGDDVNKSDFLKAMSDEYDMEVAKARVWVKDPRVKGGGYWRNYEGTGAGMPPRSRPSHFGNTQGTASRNLTPEGDTGETNTKWISALLTNDEESTDEEIIEQLANEGGIDNDKELLHYIAQRRRALKDPLNFELKPFNKPKPQSSVPSIRDVMTPKMSLNAEWRNKGKEYIDDYDHLSGKGYSDDEIIGFWTREGDKFAKDPARAKEMLSRIKTEKNPPRPQQVVNQKLRLKPGIRSKLKRV